MGDFRSIRRLQELKEFVGNQSAPAAKPSIENGWVPVDGYVHRVCEQPAIRNSNDSNEWACVQCGYLGGAAMYSDEYRQTWTYIFKEVRNETDSSEYQCRSRREDAPRIVDCLTLILWIFQKALFSLKLPADIVQLGNCGKAVERPEPGDILIVQGLGRCDHPGLGKVGHMGIITDTGTIMHATRRAHGTVSGVIEECLEDFLAHHGPLKTIRRFFL